MFALCWFGTPIQREEKSLCYASTSNSQGPSIFIFHFYGLLEHDVFPSSHKKTAKPSQMKWHTFKFFWFLQFCYCAGLPFVLLSWKTALQGCHGSGTQDFIWASKGEWKHSRQSKLNDRSQQLFQFQWKSLNSNLQVCPKWPLCRDLVPFNVDWISSSLLNLKFDTLLKLFHPRPVSNFNSKFDVRRQKTLLTWVVKFWRWMSKKAFWLLWRKS